MNNKKNTKRKLEDKSWEEVFNSVPKYKRKAILEKMGINENLDPNSGESIIQEEQSSNPEDIQANTVADAAQEIVNTVTSALNTYGGRAPYLVQVYAAEPAPHQQTGEPVNLVIGMLNERGQETYLPFNADVTNENFLMQLAATTYGKFIEMSDPINITFASSASEQFLNRQQLAEQGVSSNGVFRHGTEGKLEKTYPHVLKSGEMKKHYINIGKYVKSSYSKRVELVLPKTPKEENVKAIGALGAIAGPLIQTAVPVLGQVAADLLGGLF